MDLNIQSQEESNAYLSVKGRVTVNITCQCSENSYFWREIEYKYQAPCWVFLISTYIPQHITLSCFICVEIKDKDYCPIEIIKGLTDKGQFQYLTKLMGPQEGTYLYATQFHSLR